MSESEKETFNANLDHAKSAYANAQAIVKFVDSKTSILTGIVTATTAIPFALLNVLLSNGSGNRFAQWFHNCENLPKAAIVGSLGLAIWVGCLSLLNSTSGLMARKPTKRHNKEYLLPELFRFVVYRTRRVLRINKPNGTPHQDRVTCLFPLFPPERETEASKVIDALEAGRMSQEHILREYGWQLRTIGIILHAKIERNQNAVRWFEIQVLFYVLCAVAALFTFVLVKPPTDSDVLEKLERLGRLKLSGLLTDAELAVQKAKLLNSGTGSSVTSAVKVPPSASEPKPVIQTPQTFPNVPSK